MRYDQQLRAIGVGQTNIRIEEVHDQIDDALRQHVGIAPRAAATPAQQQAFDTGRAEIDFMLVAHRARLNPTLENTTARDQLAPQFPRTNRANPVHPNPAIEALIRQQADLEAHNQALSTNPGSTPTLELEAARGRYQQAVSDVANLLKHEDGNHELANAHPQVMASLQADAEAARQAYKEAIEDVHQRAGTLGMLQNLSRPLDALRAESSRSPRLSVLDSTRFQFATTSGALPRVLQRLEAKTQDVNQLLEQRERLERALQTTPEIAPTIAQEVNENDKALSQAMTELTELTANAEQAGYLRTHPDIKAWAQKAAALQDAVNRKSLRQRNRAANFAGNLVASRSAILHKLAGGTVDHVQGVNSDMHYDPQAAEELRKEVGTTYFEQRGMFDWVLKNHRTLIKQADGSEKMEDIVFSKADLMEHLNDFCEEHDLKLGEDVKVKEKDGQITITWPHKMHTRPDDQYRALWLKRLETKYTEKRGVEIGREAGHEAGAEIERDPVAAPAGHAPAAIAARPPVAAGSGPVGPGTGP